MAMRSIRYWINRTTSTYSCSKARKSRAKKVTRSTTAAKTPGRKLHANKRGSLLSIWKCTDTGRQQRGAHPGIFLRVRTVAMICIHGSHLWIPPSWAQALWPQRMCIGVGLRLPFWMLRALRPSCSSPNSLLLGLLNLKRCLPSCHWWCPALWMSSFICLPSCLPPVWGLRWCNVFSKQSRHVQIMFVSAPLILLKPCAWAHNWTKWCHGLLLSLPTFIGCFFSLSRFICCACFYLNGCACVPYLDRRHVVLVLALSVPWWPTSSAARTKDPT